MKKIFQFTLCLLFTVHSIGQKGDFKFIGGTTTITLVSADTIWMAADSKQIYYLADTSKMTDVFQTKIKEVNGITFMITGSFTIRDKNDTVLVSYYDLMTECIKGTNTIDSAIIVFIQKCTKRTNELMTINGSLFTQLYHLQSKLFQLSIAGSRNGKPVARFFDFNLIQFMPEYISVNMVETTRSNINDIYPTGFSKEIYKIVGMPGFSLSPQLIKESLMYMIELEKLANPKYVGGTIDVVQIFGNGIKWLTDNHY